LSDSFDVRTYWERRLGQEYSLAGVGYQRLGRHYNAWMYRVRARVFDRVLHHHGIGPGSNVLDIGSGTGFYIERWQAAGARSVTGVDITDLAVQALRTRYPTHRFVQADISTTLPDHDALPPASFEAVSAIDVLFHIVDDDGYRRAFVNIASLLKPGGWLIWSDNFLRHGTERVEHQVSRSLAESEGALRDAGFEIVARVPMFVLMNYPSDTRSRLARLAWTAMVAPSALVAPLGWVLGAALYPFERWLTATLTESPTTEIMICRKL
jgi:SAM-dependent methyltransferase